MMKKKKTIHDDGIKLSAEEVRVRPHGFIDEIVFELGHHKCGDESDGYGVYISDGGKWRPGGVITRPQMATLVEIFTRRLKENPASNA